MSYSILLTAVMWFFSNILFFDSLCNISVFLTTLFPAFQSTAYRILLGFFFPSVYYISATQKPSYILSNALEILQNYP